MTTVRAENPRDVEDIRGVNELAFETPAEARLVDRLRERGKLLLSLVAEDYGRIMGHIALSRVDVASRPDVFGVGLGPMAVVPTSQNQGVGSQLVRDGLSQSAALGARFAVVLGHPGFYPRFGFLPASRFRLSCSWPVPDEVFMAVELVAGALAGV